MILESQSKVRINKEFIIGLALLIIFVPLGLLAAGLPMVKGGQMKLRIGLDLCLMG